MSTKSINAREALQQALKAHDTAAITHMKAAKKHLREGRALAERIEHLKKDKR